MTRRSLDGIEPEENDGDDYEVWDVAEDDSLVGRTVCRQRIAKDSLRCITTTPTRRRP
jgi:hypothetical protein